MDLAKSQCIQKETEANDIDWIQKGNVPLKQGPSKNQTTASGGFGLAITRGSRQMVR